ncbi:MAG TPA: hypothetical protein VH107_05970 [Lacipirellulaceae bacterium]|nr:hypothetical protein [Lacipirellulaceae bacterium]
MTAGLGFVGLGLFSLPATTLADEGTGPPCNEGGDPSMPLGCFGWCYSPKICTTHPIKLVCTCR